MLLNQGIVDNYNTIAFVLDASPLLELEFGDPLFDVASEVSVLDPFTEPLVTRDVLDEVESSLYSFSFVRLKLEPCFCFFLFFSFALLRLFGLSSTESGVISIARFKVLRAVLLFLPPVKHSASPRHILFKS